MARKLKVFRTPIGFHDAYVAAPSQKAALEAWGADSNLFARGTAEQVTDSALMERPLERPGEVIRVSRGDLKAQLKALGGRKPANAKAKAKPQKGSASAPKPKPPPKRDKLDKAEAALSGARDKHAQERETIEREREALERRLAELTARQDKEIARLKGARDKAQREYRTALDEWSG